MKKLFFLSFVLVGNVVADVLPPPAATPAEVSAGLSRSKYVSPYSLTASGIGTQTNGITAATATNIVNGMRQGAGFDTGGNAASATVASNIVAGTVVNPLSSLTTTNFQIYEDGAGGGITMQYGVSIVYNPFNITSDPIARLPLTIDLQTARTDTWETTLTQGNAIFWGGNNQAGGLFGGAIIVGGTGNTNNGNDTLIAAGGGNYADGVDSFLGAGQSNHQNASHSVIVGGDYNSQYEILQGAFIGAGLGNFQFGAEWSGIVAGVSNRLGGLGEIAIGSHIHSTNNFAVHVGYSTNTLIVETNGFVTARGNLVFRGNGNGLTNITGLGFTNSLTINAGDNVQTNKSRYTIVANNQFADIDTPYTNRNQKAFVQFNVAPSGALDNDGAYAYLLVDQDHDGVFEDELNFVGATFPSVANATFLTMQISAHLQPRARFMLAATNTGVLGQIQIQGSRITYE